MFDCSIEVLICVSIHTVDVRAISVPSKLPMLGVSLSVISTPNPFNSFPMAQ
jgi:hypothetical protein